MWTPELYRIFGLPQDFEPTMRNSPGFIVAQDVPAVEASIMNARTTGQAQRLEFRARRPNGEIRYCLSITEVEDGAPLPADMVYGLVQDLTDLRRAEEERRKLEQQVMQSQKLESLGVLAGGIAHDFNNLLTSILGNADLAHSELAPAHPARTYLEDIESVSRRAADLCRQMLAYSGKGRFVVQPLSLNDVVREMGHLLSVSISKKVVIKYNFFAELPSVMADATQMRQVVMNLITNASEAIGEASGVVTLSTGVMDCDEAYLRGVVGDNDPHPAGQYVYLEVSDTGCGMDQDTLGRIFDPFFTTKFMGRGLGLAAVLGMVRRHHGAIRVQSQPGIGSTFQVLFPPAAQPCLPAQPEPDLTVGATGTNTVLVVDDEPEVLEVASLSLSQLGFRVLTAPDGRAALDVFRTHAGEIDAVLLDLMMPHLNGAEVFEQMQRLRPNVPVVVASGYSEEDVVTRLAGGAYAGFVQKPFRATALATKLRAAMHSRGQRIERMQSPANSTDGLAGDEDVGGSHGA